MKVTFTCIQSLWGIIWEIKFKTKYECKSEFFCFVLAIVENLPWWTCGLKLCNWLLAVSHHSLVSNTTRSMWESYQWPGVRWRFSLGTPVSSTSYNWLVATQMQHGRKSDKIKIPNLAKVTYSKLLTRRQNHRRWKFVK